MKTEIFLKGFMFRNSIRDVFDNEDYLIFSYEQYKKNYEKIVRMWNKENIVFPYKKDITFEEFKFIWGSN